MVREHVDEVLLEPGDMDVTFLVAHTKPMMSAIHACLWCWRIRCELEDFVLCIC
ncbi:hypothetical protein PVAP13_2NG327200 [Panicum virgatum]|uniref:Uncharacterized protein n=1 Tax=Panicum virgatum TaxID=38727 RepID=A0A8T0VEY9_PANVG|nr:hypothetical protein PVAP13_2NG327200 [Panicum virgatum]